jgi:hypothetical protein
MEVYTPPDKSSSSKTSSAGGKKKKAKKDPNAPKRGKSSFMFYSNEIRATIKEENPDLSFGDLGKLIGSKFKALEADEKEKYTDLAQKDKERYQKEMAGYKVKQEEEAADSDDSDEDSDGVNDAGGDDSDDSDSDSD